MYGLMILNPDARGVVQREVLSTGGVLTLLKVGRRYNVYIASPHMMEAPEELARGVKLGEARQAFADALKADVMELNPCGGRRMNPGSLYHDLKRAGVPLDHHETDLYALATPEALRILARYPRQSYSRFVSNIDGKMWLDIPFAFDPAWQRKPGMRRNPSADWHRREARRQERLAARLRAEGDAGDAEFHAAQARVHDLYASPRMGYTGKSFHHQAAMGHIGMLKKKPESVNHAAGYYAHDKAGKASRKNPYERYRLTLAGLPGVRPPLWYKRKRDATQHAKGALTRGATGAEVFDTLTRKYWVWARGPRGGKPKIIRSGTGPARANPGALGVLTRGVQGLANPKKKSAGAGYRMFHGKNPDQAYKTKVPKGFPRRLWFLGKLHRLELTDGTVLKGGVVAAGTGNTIYLLGVKGKPRKKTARVKQIEYRPPKNSQKAGAVYYHPFKRPPSIKDYGRGYFRIAGKGVKLSPRGIIG